MPAPAATTPTGAVGATPMGGAATPTGGAATPTGGAATPTGAAAGGGGGRGGRWQVLCLQFDAWYLLVGLQTLPDLVRLYIQRTCNHYSHTFHACSKPLPMAQWCSHCVPTSHACSKPLPMQWRIQRGFFVLKRTPLLFIEQYKNRCGLVKSGCVPWKIDEKNPPCESSGSAPAMAQ